MAASAVTVVPAAKAFTATAGLVAAASAAAEGQPVIDPAVGRGPCSDDIQGGGSPGHGVVRSSLWRLQSCPRSLPRWHQRCLLRPRSWLGYLASAAGLSSVRDGLGLPWRSWRPRFYPRCLTNTFCFWWFRRQPWSCQCGKYGGCGHGSVHVCQDFTCDGVCCSCGASRDDVRGIGQGSAYSHFGSGRGLTSEMSVGTRCKARPHTRQPRH